jgi:hypothetical protein
MAQHRISPPLAGIDSLAYTPICLHPKAFFLRDAGGLATNRPGKLPSGMAAQAEPAVAGIKRLARRGASSGSHGLMPCSKRCVTDC